MWEASAWPHRCQDLWREEGHASRPPLAGFPAGQGPGLITALQTQLWRHPDRVLLGSHCSALHVSEASHQLSLSQWAC